MEFSGQRIYLGRWGDASTKEAYERTVAEWLSNRRTIPVDRQQITVTELLTLPPKPSPASSVVILEVVRTQFLVHSRC